jgi:hypothetical protein
LARDTNIICVGAAVTPVADAVTDAAIGRLGCVGAIAEGEGTGVGLGDTPAVGNEVTVGRVRLPSSRR